MATNNNKLGRVVLLHGVRLSSSDINYVAKLAPAFRRQGFCVIAPRYGFVSAILAGLFSWVDRRIAESISNFILPGDILVGHSNGGTIAYLISQKKELKGVVLINAALDTARVPNAEFVHVYYNEDDWIAKLSSIFPFSPWGQMGGVGYKGDDPRVTNFDEKHPIEADLPPLSGHKAIFYDENVRPWSKFMAEYCARAVEALKLSGD